MKVFLLKNVERIGMAGEIIKVSDGYATNYLIPNKLGIEVNEQNEHSFKLREKKIEKRKEVVATQTSMLAEKISSLIIVIKRKLHDDGKLYGALSLAEIVDALAEKSISVAKNQIDMPKAIKEKGTHEVTIRLSSRLQPKVTVKVVSE